MLQKMQRKVMVFGAGGQLGIELCREFERRQWSVQRLDRRALDVTDQVAVEHAIAQADPELIINSAAYNQVDIAESEPLVAFQANALAVRNLAVACRQSGARLVHYSTDYVFDGTKGSAYVESDMPHPRGAYGISKMAGELYAQAYLDNPLILRTSGVFGPGGMYTPRGNFLELMLRLAASGKPITVVEDHFGSPAYAPAVAVCTADLVERDIGGLFHLGGGEAISWFRYAQLIFEAAGLNPSLTPTGEGEYPPGARRPIFSPQPKKNVTATGITPMPPFREAIDAYFKARQHATAHRAV